VAEVSALTRAQMIFHTLSRGGGGGINGDTNSSPSIDGCNRSRSDGLRLHLSECRNFSRASSFHALVTETALRVRVEPVPSCQWGNKGCLCS
jgi:hypothetical protein